MRNSKCYVKVKYYKGIVLLLLLSLIFITQVQVYAEGEGSEYGTSVGVGFYEGHEEPPKPSQEPIMKPGPDKVNLNLPKTGGSASHSMIQVGLLTTVLSVSSYLILKYRRGKS